MSESKDSTTSPTNTERHFGEAPDTPQVPLPLARDGTETTFWHLQYGDILIETRDGVTYVNGSPVKPIEQTINKAPVR